MGQFRKVLFWMAGRPGGRAAGRVGEMESKAILASNLKLKLKLTEAELGNYASLQACLNATNLCMTMDVLFLMYPSYH